MALKGRRLQRRIEEAQAFLAELADGAIDDTQEIAQRTDELLADWEGEHPVKSALLGGAEPKLKRAAASKAKAKPKRKPSAEIEVRAQMTIHFRVAKRPLLVDLEKMWKELVDVVGRARFDSLDKATFAPSGLDSVYVAGTGPGISVELEAHPRGSSMFASRLSMLRMTAPVAEMVADPRAWRDRFVALCERVPDCAGGLAGHVAMCELEALPIPAQQKARASMVALVNAQPGIDLPFDDGSTLLMTKSIHGIGWLTALSDQQLKRVRGVDHLRKQGGELLTFPGGAALQAGPRPETGAEGRLPEAYAQVLAIVKPVLAPYRRYPG